MDDMIIQDLNTHDGNLGKIHCGQSYKASTIINYNFKVVLTRKLPDRYIYNSRVEI